MYLFPSPYCSQLKYYKALFNLLMGTTLSCHSPWLLFFLETTIWQDHDHTTLLSGGSLTGSIGPVAPLDTPLQWDAGFPDGILETQDLKGQKAQIICTYLLHCSSSNWSYPHNTTTYLPQCSHRHQKSKYIITVVDELSIVKCFPVIQIISSMAMILFILMEACWIKESEESYKTASFLSL